MSVAPKLTAWDLEAELLYALDALESAPDGEVSSELHELVASCLYAAAEKRDALAGAYKRRQAEMAALVDRALDAEIKAKRMERSLERFDAYILGLLDMHGEKQLHGNQYKIGWAQNPPRVEVADGYIIPGEFVREKPAVYEPDKRALREALDRGEQIEGVTLVEGSRRIVIR